jgi:hypothetical protein
MAELPTNKELAAEAEALGIELGVEVVTAGLNKAGLLELVEELRARRAAHAPPAPGADPQAPTDTNDASGASSDDAGASTEDGASTEEASTEDDASIPFAEVDSDGDEDDAELAELRQEDADATQRLRHMLGMLREDSDLREEFAHDPIAAAEMSGLRAFMAAISQHFAATGKPKLAAAFAKRAALLSAALKPRTCRVAPGRSLCTSRGILVPGAEVSAADVAGGEERITKLVNAGILIRT